jgi:hypothetical protein
MTAALGINDRVNETLEITGQLKSASQVANFLSFLAYGRSSIVKTLNQTSFHMRRMLGVEVEISASVGGFPVNFGGQCHPFSDGQNNQKTNHNV